MSVSTADQKRKCTPIHPSIKDVTARSRAISCDSCERCTHIKCVGVLTDSAYDQLCSSTVIYDRCSIHALPFPDVSAGDDMSDQPPISHSFVRMDGILTMTAAGLIQLMTMLISRQMTDPLISSALSQKALTSYT